ncbi:amino acid adenylation domain-containing protein [Brenneria sp. g21c3]|uniref:amino acid adenylation domain-containing protein n=1 Tax=Brenneria sp. g21c3 TaxID=3093893 RepID=UPI002EC71494|nr:amino acid adenylation domain-containing protein [Brenneria sp. g21c3]
MKNKGEVQHIDSIDNSCESLHEESVEIIFPMSDMQQAYWIGRQDELSNDTSAMHVYFEIDVKDLCLDKFKNAWQRLLRRHDMLRVVALNDGNQKILSEIPPYDIAFEDISVLPASEQDTVLLAARNQYAQRKADISNWPQFSICIFKMNHISRVIISLDIWCIDGRSLYILFSELNQLYISPETVLEPLEYSFREYIFWLKAQEKTGEYQSALAHWKNRIPDLFDAPKLPLAQYSGKGCFTRIDHQFGPDETKKLFNIAASLGVTTNGLLLGMFAEVLSYWSASKQFTLNIPRFNRPQIHHQINDVIGEFATFTLLSMDLTIYPSLKERIIGIQKQLWQEMEYGIISGVKILREIMKLSGTSKFGAMPIVFTSSPESLNKSSENEKSWFGDMIFSLSQTPQVWLDCQYHISNNKLSVNWDYVQERFPEQMVVSMFDTYKTILLILSQENAENYLQQNHVFNLPKAQLARRNPGNGIHKKYDSRPLYRQLAERLAQPNQSGKTAVIAGDGQLDYQTLYEQSSRLGWHLSRQFKPGAPQAIVAILLPKSRLQIVSVWGVLASGAAYLPLDIEQPAERLRTILSDARPAVVIVDGSTRHRLNDVAGVSLLDLDEQRALITEGAVPAAPDLPGYRSAEDDLVYVIYTSGTTGIPKGVMIESRGVLNAIDYSRRVLFGAIDNLVIMGVSALHHDMSVFDVLGGMVSGGLLVLPDEAERKNPEAWSTLINEHRVNSWVSVPAMMEMLLTWSDHKKYHFASLQVVLLGGDWIPLTLAERVRGASSEQTALYSVGGPTETTMWNIAQAITEEEGWSSVPYGRPIANCTYRILNASLEDVPDWAVGEMYCGGISLARGYLNDEARTQARFITHPESGERLYRTGDLGFYHPDGRIEFVGRQDGQLKVRGNRVEAGEVRARLETWPEISRALVYLYEGSLTAALLLYPGQARLNNDELYRRAKAELSAAMVPGIWLQLYALPLTANAKVDMQALLEKTRRFISTGDTAEEQGNGIRPLSRIESRLAGLWGELLGQRPENPDDNFFALGGDSLLLIRLLAKIQKTFDVTVSLPDLFTYLKLHEQANIVNNLTSNSKSDNIIRPLELTEYPLSFSQEDIWLGEKISSGKVRFRISLGFYCDDNLDIDMLHQALACLRNRHFVLACVFSLTSAGITQHTDLEKDIPVFYENPIDKAELDYVTKEIVKYSFDLSKEYGWRVHILPIKEGGYALVFNFHHAIFDGWSIPIFFNELQELYNSNCSTPISRNEKSICYGDYAVWNRAFINAHEDDSCAFWLSKLSGGEALIPFDYSTAPIAKSLQSEVTASTFELIHKLVQEQQTTHFIILLSAFQITLASVFFKDDFFIGTSNFGRENIQTHDMLGCFISNPIFHAKYNSNLSFYEVIHDVNNEHKKMIKYQALSFAKIAEKMGKSGFGEGINQLCQVCFVMQPSNHDEFSLGNCEMTGFDIDGDDVRLIYELSCWPKNNSIQFKMKYDNARTSDVDAEYLMKKYIFLLDELVKNPNIKIKKLISNVQG